MSETVRTETINTALGALERVLDRRLVAALEVCARCGICAEACHVYASDPRPEHVPAARAERVRAVYRRQHDPLGKLFPWLVGAKDLTEPDLDALAEPAFASCTLCRRCTINCPFGVDTALIMRAARAMLTATDRAPEMLVMLADAAIARGEHAEEFREIYREIVAGLEHEAQERLGDPTLRIPLDQQGAEILYVGLSGAHTILPAAIIFHEANASWTLSMFEASNYGLFLGDPARAKAIARRIVDEAVRLGVKEVVLTECGHAYAALRWEAPNWFGGEFPFKVRSIVEVLADYVRDGRLALDPTANPEPVTYHDSCNLARNGGLIEAPRIVLRAAVQNFVEMNPHGKENFCCGGGGGLVAIPEWFETRMRAGRKKAEQIRAAGAPVVATSCENCNLQLTDLNGYYDLNVQVVGLMELVVNALLKARRRHAVPLPEAA
ncbi:MAG: (Fe-S)-binding protein [Armatimonadota bacterium]|nr:(Fe-S)-binding protein [Armatimonadota bacterium]MDR7450519.1 (Fe-S)-binding protein [Armatimonadota bacterium]MDR7466348.1 (Fe-S)-binding protein [Armatimonadota bacterium]MDR7493069.1 (Fe-S)-binding protein [Armatimonadota bacterium]MDR7498174.1 (Fe-S)-binding protein [Armatimonadota bacterium]